MVIALLLLVLLQASSGLFITDDILLEGPLYALVSGDTSEWLYDMHHTLFDILTVLIFLHIAAIVFYWLFKRTNLVRAMLDGSAEMPATTENKNVTNVEVRSPWLGLIVFAVCYAGVYFGLRWLAG